MQADCSVTKHRGHTRIGWRGFLNHFRQIATNRPAISGSAQISAPVPMLNRTQTATGIRVNADRRAAQSSRSEVNRMAAAVEIHNDANIATGSAGLGIAKATATHVISANRPFMPNCRLGVLGA
jgi:hypothetical protein